MKWSLLLFCVSLAITRPGLAENLGLVPYTVDELKSIPFQPFTLLDLQDPLSRVPLKPTDLISIDQAGKKTSIKAQDLLDKYNQAERTLNSIGKSLRDGVTKLEIRAIVDPDIWLRQRAQDFGLDLQTMAERMKPSLSPCPQLGLSNLGRNPRTQKNYVAKDVIVVPKLGERRVGDVMKKLQAQQETFCKLGFSLTDVPLAQDTSDALQNVLNMRSEILQSLDISEFSSLFDLAEDISSLVPKDAQQVFDAAQDALNNPTPERLFELGQELGDFVAADLDLPSVPSIPGPKLDKHYDLKLKKSWDWKFDKGNKETAYIYALVNGELRSGRIEDPKKKPSTAQSFQALADAGFYVINNQVSVLNGSVDSRLDETNAYARARFCMLGNCMEKSADVKDFSIKVNDPNLFTKNWEQTYSQQLSIGPIPVVVRVGALMAANLGYDLGMNLLGVTGGALATIQCEGVGEAAVGIKDFVEAGAGGKLTLIRNTTEIRADARVRFIGNGIPSLTGSLVGTNDMSALDGRIYGYAMIDALGPLGPYVEDIVKSLKELGAAGKALLDKLGKISEVAKKVINKIGDAADAVGGAAKDGVEAVADFLGWHRPVTLHGSPMGLSIQGTKIRYEHDVIKWPPIRKKIKFLNYRVAIGPDGKNYSGDLNEANDNELEKLEQSMTLATKKELLASLEAQAKEYENIVFEAVQSQDTTPNIKLLNDYSQTVQNLFSDLNRRSLEALNRVKGVLK